MAPNTPPPHGLTGLAATKSVAKNAMVFAVRAGAGKQSGAGSQCCGCASTSTRAGGKLNITRLRDSSRKPACCQGEGARKA